LNEIIENILTRRSIRSYTEKQIADDDLNLILKAAIYAPSGSNSQSWHFTVVQNKAKLEQLNELVREALQNMVVDEKTYRSKRAAKLASENAGYNFYYHAPTLIIASNEREYVNAMADCAVALENIFLAAHSLGLGSCWINQLAWLCDEPALRKALTELGVPEAHMVCGAAALGHKANNDPNPTPRKEGSVTIVR
jgi:nitroreductase